jgi:hypothetical protein
MSFKYMIMYIYDVYGLYNSSKYHLDCVFRRRDAKIYFTNIGGGFLFHYKSINFVKFDDPLLAQYLA